MLCTWGKRAMAAAGAVVALVVVPWPVLALVMLAAAGPLGVMVRSTYEAHRGKTRGARRLATLADTSARPPGVLFTWGDVATRESDGTAPTFGDTLPGGCGCSLPPLAVA